MENKKYFEFNDIKIFDTQMFTDESFVAMVFQKNNIQTLAQLFEKYDAGEINYDLDLDNNENVDDIYTQEEYYDPKQVEAVIKLLRYKYLDEDLFGNDIIFNEYYYDHFMYVDKDKEVLDIDDPFYCDMSALGFDYDEIGALVIFLYHSEEENIINFFDEIKNRTMSNYLKNDNMLDKDKKDIVFRQKTQLILKCLNRKKLNRKNDISLLKEQLNLLQQEKNKQKKDYTHLSDVNVYQTDMFDEDSCVTKILKENNIQTLEELFEKYDAGEINFDSFSHIDPDCHLDYDECMKYYMDYSFNKIDEITFLEKTNITAPSELFNGIVKLLKIQYLEEDEFDVDLLIETEYYGCSNSECFFTDIFQNLVQLGIDYKEISNLEIKLSDDATYKLIDLIYSYPVLNSPNKRLNKKLKILEKSVLSHEEDLKNVR